MHIFDSFRVIADSVIATECSMMNAVYVDPSVSVGVSTVCYSLLHRKHIRNGPYLIWYGSR